LISIALLMKGVSPSQRLRCGAGINSPARKEIDPTAATWPVDLEQAFSKGILPGREPTGVVSIFESSS
jgi:hypothetical protein